MPEKALFEKSELTQLIEILLSAHQGYQEKFQLITRRAHQNFAHRKWKSLQADTVERLGLYRNVIDETETVLRDRFGPQIDLPHLWMTAKKVYIQKIVQLRDRELAETFFNSITRRLFRTVGVNAEIEFINSEFDRKPAADIIAICRSYTVGKDLSILLTQILRDYHLDCDYEDQPRDIRQACHKLQPFLAQGDWSSNTETCIDMVKHPFYRDHGAYLVGRMINGRKVAPLVLALRNGIHGIYLDAILLRSEQLRVLFSFSRAYFFVEVERPHELVEFLKPLMPQKKRAEIYISIGFDKHGKTELYRHLMTYLKICSLDRFRLSQGKRGMVMIAFNMPNDDMIFKLIRDRFEQPKKTSRDEVMQRYNYVFKHERAGRLLDVQTFEHLKIDTCFFEENLIDELLNEASQSVTLENDHLIFEHIYVERRVTPLDIFLQQADWHSSKAAVIDFGWAIKDLAKVNIFPGDMLIKNFGVSRLGRVVFYDYDELCPLTSCNFRKIPPPRNEWDELASEPWYVVDENDVFPEEFKFFLGFPDDLEQVFVSVHEDLFDVNFWQRTKARILSGELIHISPYGTNIRFEK